MTIKIVNARRVIKQQLISKGHRPETLRTGWPLSTLQAIWNSPVC